MNTWDKTCSNTQHLASRPQVRDFRSRPLRPARLDAVVVVVVAVVPLSALWPRSNSHSHGLGYTGFAACVRVSGH